MKLSSGYTHTELNAMTCDHVILAIIADDDHGRTIRVTHLKARLGSGRKMYMTARNMDGHYIHVSNAWPE